MYTCTVHGLWAWGISSSISDQACFNNCLNYFINFASDWVTKFISISQQCGTVKPELLAAWAMRPPLYCSHNATVPNTIQYNYNTLYLHNRAILTWPKGDLIRQVSLYSYSILCTTNCTCSTCTVHVSFSSPWLELIMREGKEVVRKSSPVSK